MTPKLQKVGVHLIIIDAGTQSREMINEITVQEYVELWHAGADFPPLDVFQDGEDRYFLADGFHRLLAAKIARKTTVPCRIFRGNARAAFLHACGANSTHGLRRTNSDKRHMVSILLADPEWAAWTDSRIADVCGVSHPFVATLRKECQSIPNSAAARVMDQARCGVDGKSYPATRKRRSGGDPNVKKSNAGRERADVKPPRQKAIAALQELSKLLRRLGLYDRHSSALKTIARDVREELLKKNDVLMILPRPINASALEVVATS